MSGPMLFEPISIRDVTLKNRVVVSPMHQYSGVKGFATDWHLMNAGRYATDGAGLVIMESTKVERRGCGTVADLGLWDDAFRTALNAGQNITTSGHRVWEFCRHALPELAVELTSGGRTSDGA